MILLCTSKSSRNSKTVFGGLAINLRSNSSGRCWKNIVPSERTTSLRSSFNFASRTSPEAPEVNVTPINAGLIACSTLLLRAACNAPGDGALSAATAAARPVTFGFGLAARHTSQSQFSGLLSSPKYSRICLRRQRSHRA
jgi:hypothetical protein